LACPKTLANRGDIHAGIDRLADTAMAQSVETQIGLNVTLTSADISQLAGMELRGPRNGGHHCALIRGGIAKRSFLGLRS